VQANNFDVQFKTCTHFKRGPAPRVTTAWNTAHWKDEVHRRCV